MARASRRETRTLLIGVGVAVAALLTRGIVVPVLRNYSAALAALEQERGFRQREERLVGDRVKMLALALQLRDSMKSASGRVLGARAATTAAMQLASRVRELALDEDMRGIQVTDFGSDSLAGTLRRVRMQVEAQGGFGQLADLIDSIESDPLPMNIADLEIVAAGSATFANGGATARPGIDPVLRFRAVVTALARVEAHSK